MFKGVLLEGIFSEPRSNAWERLLPFSAQLSFEWALICQEPVLLSTEKYIYPSWKRSCLAEDTMDWECRLPEGLSRSATLTALPGAIWTLLGWEWALHHCFDELTASTKVIPSFLQKPLLQLSSSRLIHLISHPFPFLVTSAPPLLTSETQKSSAVCSDEILILAIQAFPLVLSLHALLKCPSPALL